MGEKIYKTVSTSSSDEIIKDVTKVLKKVSIGNLESDDTVLPGLENNEASSNNSYENSEVTSESNTKFKVCTTTALAKPTIWTKIKNVLLTEITVKLTPRQQKMEDEINEFLHQEITWKSVKDFALQEVPITWKGKRIL